MSYEKPVPGDRLGTRPQGRVKCLCLIPSYKSRYFCLTLIFPHVSIDQTPVVVIFCKLYHRTLFFYQWILNSEKNLYSNIIQNHYSMWNICIQDMLPITYHSCRDKQKSDAFFSKLFDQKSEKNVQKDMKKCSETNLLKLIFPKFLYLGAQNPTYGILYENE